MKRSLRRGFYWGVALSLALLVGCPPPLTIIKIPPPPLSNPIQIDTNEHQRCAIDDTGLHCWGEIISFDSSLVQAWEQSGLTQLDIAITNPQYFSLESAGLCVIGETETFCQRTEGLVLDALKAAGIPGMFVGTKNSRIPVVDQFQFSKPSVIRMPPYFFPICVISALGVECSDPEAVIPPLTNPVAMDVGEKHGCAIDINGLHCWKVAELMGLLPSEYLPALEAAITLPADLVNPSQVAVGVFECLCTG